MTDHVRSDGAVNCDHIGRVSIRDYVERIFDEREKSVEKDRVQIERAVAEAKITSEKALQDAKSAADQVSQGLAHRLTVLESGGAPFASRLDDSLKILKNDVDALKDEAVRSTALREEARAASNAVEQQRKQIRLVIIGSGFTFAITVISILVGIMG